MKITVDCSQFKEFSGKMGGANDDLKNMLAEEMQKVGIEFLNMVAKEVISTDAVDTRNLLKSFSYGGTNSIFEIMDNGMTIEVGSTVDYASYVNDGHMTRPGPKQRWVDGRRFWDHAIYLFEREYPKQFEQVLQQWLNKHFK